MVHWARFEWNCFFDPSLMPYLGWIKVRKQTPGLTAILHRHYYCYCCKCVRGTTACTQRSEDSSVELVLTFHLYVSSENQIQVLRLPKQGLSPSPTAILILPSYWESKPLSDLPPRRHCPRWDAVLLRIRISRTNSQSLIWSPVIPHTYTMYLGHIHTPMSPDNSPWTLSFPSQFYLLLFL